MLSALPITLLRGAAITLLVAAPLLRGGVYDWFATLISLTGLWLAAAIVVDRFRHGLGPWPPTALDGPLAGVLLLGLASLAASGHRFTAFWALVLFAGEVTFFYAVVQGFAGRRRSRHLARAIVGIAVFLALFGIAKRSGWNPFFWWDYAPPGLNRELAAASSTYGNPNHYAGFLVMALPLCIALRAAEHPLSRLRPAMGGGCLLLAVALVLSGSRAGWISAAAAVVFLAAAWWADGTLRLRRLLPAAGIVIGLLALVVLTDRGLVLELRSLWQEGGAGSLMSRLTIWKAMGPMIADHPWLGVGPGMFALTFTRYQPPEGVAVPVRYLYAHNDYLQFVAELGLVLGPLMIWALVAFYRRGFRRARRTRSRTLRRLVQAGMASVTGLLVFGITDFNLHLPANALVFAAVAGLVVGVDEGRGATVAPWGRD